MSYYKLAAAALGFSIVVSASQVHAIPITFSTTGSSEYVFFEGTDHSVSMHYQGSDLLGPYDPNPIDLEIGVPLTDVIINAVPVTTADPPGLGPVETQTLIQTITVDGVSAQLTQEVTAWWTAGSQVTVTFDPSETATLDLGPVGLLQVTVQGKSVQFQANHSSQGSFISATFLLVPEPTTLSLLALGGMALLRRR